MKIQHLLICSVCLFQMNQTMAMGLVESYSLAQSVSPKLKYAEYELEATKEELSKANAAFYPRVQLSMSQGRGSTDAKTSSTLNSGQRNYTNKNYNLNLKQPLLNFTLNPEKKIATESIAMSELDVSNEKIHLFSSVSEKYFDVLYAIDIQKNLEQKQASYLKQKIQAEKRYQSGVAVKNDISDIDAEIALLKAQIIEAEVRTAVARKNFQLLVGVDPQDLNGLDYKSLKSMDVSTTTMETWIELAFHNNPVLQKADRQINLSSHKYEKDKYSDYPTLDLVLTRSYTQSDSNITIGSQYDTTSGVVQLNVPIFAGGYYSAQKRQSALLIDAAKSDRDIKANEVVEKITDAYTQLQNSKSLIEAYDDAIKSYEVSLAGTNKAYLAGTRTIADVLKVRDKLMDSHLNLSKACYSYLLSFIQLKELAGDINQDDYAMIDALMKSGSFVLNLEPSQDPLSEIEAL